MIPTDMSFVLLDAGLTVEMALRRMDRFGNSRWVVIRRCAGAHIYWYSYEADETRRQFDSLRNRELTVGAALDLHEWKSRPAHSLNAEGGPAPQRGDIVLTPANQVAGVAKASLAPPPPPPAPAVSAPAPAQTAPLRRPRRGGEPPPPPMPSMPFRLFGFRSPLATIEDGAAVGSSPRETAPFRAWPNLQAPLAVEDGQQFIFDIGFALRQVPGVSGGIIDLPAMPAEFDLQVQIVAIGFESPQGLQHTLHVFRDEPEREKLHLTLVAKIGTWPAEEHVAHRVLGVIFSYQGMPCGMAQRNILVAQPGFPLLPSDLDSPSSFANQSACSVPVWARGDVTAPDLTVMLRRYDGNAARSNFAWSFESPHPIPLPAPIPCEIADDAASYARGITSEIVKLGDAGSPLICAHIEGSGRDISDHVPRKLWEVIAEVRKHLGTARSVPDVFFVTEESCIPWELAVMPKPLDPAKPAFFGAQVNIGRWIVGDPVPHLPPDPLVDVQRMVVVYGDYPEAANKLPEALKERDCLSSKYAATAVGIDDAAMVEVLEGTNPNGGCQVLHFACHGSGDPSQPAYTHLMTHSGAPLTDNALRGAALGERNSPFLFLNACEAGTAGDELGTASGFVEASLKGGFRGFVGALWSVASDTASDIAIEFYKRTLEDGASVAEAMREMRCRFKKSQEVPDDTHLAYVFYGHPGLKLRRKS
jgi:hypothetical protein